MQENRFHQNLMQQEINAFCRCFGRLSGVHIGIHNLDYSQKSTENTGSFCSFCNYRCKEYLDQCRHDDQVHLEAAAACGTVTVYQCHMGMTEVIIPIKDSDTTLGVVFMGQLYVVPDERISFDAVFQRLKKDYPGNFWEDCRAQLQQLYEKIPKMTKETLDDWINVVSLAARGLYISHWLNQPVVTPETRFRQYMEQMDVVRMPLSEISAKEIARQMNISYSQLNRLSAKVLGMPLKQYILKIKTTAAAELLCTQKTMSVREAAAAVGIEDPHYFSRLFMERMGCRCTEYRDRMAPHRKKDG